MAKRTIRLDMNELTLGDLELFEDAVGGNLMEALTPQIVRDANGKPVPDPDDPKGHPLKRIAVSAKTMVGLVYIALRKDDPTITLEQAKAIPLNDLDFDIENAEGEPDPTELGETPQPPSEPSSEGNV